MMKFVIFTLALIAALGVSQSEVNVCQGVANNMFLPVVGDCSSYYICIDEVAIQQRCNNGTFFDANAQSCTSAADAHCLPNCTSALSSFCYDRTCTKYVLCYSGVPVVRECCDGLQYNVETDRCDFAEFVDCVDNMCTLFDNNPNNIVFLTSKSACDKYFICQDGQAIPQTCSKGLKFNPKCDCCDFPSNVNCTITTLQRNVMPYSKVPPKSADIKCPVQGVHFQAHAQPELYYFCMNGRGVILECTPGLVYDPKMESCREQKNLNVNEF